MNEMRFSPSLCLTHNCNLNCIYCYQKHDNQSKMTISTAIHCIDWIFNNIPPEMNGVEIGFIGGEPLLEFELIKQIFRYTNQNYYDKNYVFYATTNGTVLTDEMKKWFRDNRHMFVLGLSLGGTPDTHNYNRSNSYDEIDFDFFLETWPNQGVKMTVSEYSLAGLSANVQHIHSLGFNEIGGVNLFEGNFDWSSERFIETIIPQLESLVDFYEKHDEISVCQMLDRKIELCETLKEHKKWCGIGTGTIFFDTDGRRFPCPFLHTYDF